MYARIASVTVATRQQYTGDDRVQQQAHYHTRRHELALERRFSHVLHDASISPNRERDQGQCTLAFGTRQRSVCEELPGRVFLVISARQLMEPQSHGNE